MLISLIKCVRHSLMNEATFQVFCTYITIVGATHLRKITIPLRVNHICIHNVRIYICIYIYAYIMCVHACARLFVHKFCASYKQAVSHMPPSFHTWLRIQRTAVPTSTLQAGFLIAELVVHLSV